MVASATCMPGLGPLTRSPCCCLGSADIFYTYTGWCFGTCVTFHFIYGMSSFPLTNSYFSEGLKPPTSIYIYIYNYTYNPSMPYTPTMFLCREKPIVEVAIPRYQNLETVPRVAKAINVARRRCRGNGGAGAFPKRFPWGEETGQIIRKWWVFHIYPLVI